MSKPSISVLDLTVLATGAISEGEFVGYDGAVGAANENAQGVALSDAASGDYISVRVLGVASCIAGGTLAVGDPVACDANSHAAKMDGTTLTVTTGRALEAAASGEDVKVLLIPS